MPAKPAPITDPYLTLGLEPGAPMAEVKRAYRQLAKAFHPDSAGEQAIPRFLAIQAAYDQIRTGRVTLGGARPGRGSAASTAGGPAGAQSEPWRADPARAQAARERARAGGGTPKGEGASGAGGGTGRAAGGRGATGTTGTGGGTRRRATRKATMGSTSYDEARDPADATWSGASWYGPSTGEYWIVNPREYADPRKHGPDYQQRARRPLQETAADAGAAPRPEPATEPKAETSTTSGPAASFEPGAGVKPGPRARSTPRWSAAATESGWTEPGDARPAPPDLEDHASTRLRWLAEAQGDPVRRFGQALVAWPPIGLVAAGLIGDATGCATFGAQCGGVEPMLPWLAQAVILGILLLVPALTRILAAGTIAVLVGVVPMTSLLLAVGAARASAAGPALGVLLGVLWLVGVGWATAMRVRLLGART